MRGRGAALVGVVTVLAAMRVVGVAASAATNVSIEVGSASIVEGDSGIRAMHFPVTLSAPSTIAVSVHYALTAGNATLGGLGSSPHFRTRTGTLSWKPSKSTGVTTTELIVSVAITPNTIATGNETFAIVLSNPSPGAYLHQSTGTGTIIDDDPETGLPKLSVGDATIYAAQAGTPHAVVVPVTLSAPSPSNVTVHYAIGGGTAARKLDYLATTAGTLTFQAGSVQRSLTVHVLPQAYGGPTKTVTVALSAISSGAVLGRNTGTVTIHYDPYTGTAAGPKVAVIGDSITLVATGSIVSGLADRYQSWVIGIPGYTIGNALPALDQQLATAPRDVISNLGTDDAFADNTGWQTSFDALMTRLANIHCVELVTLHENVADYYGSLVHNVTVTVAKDINTALTDAVATHTNMHLIDWNSAANADPTLTSDGIHPTAAGDQWLASHYRSALNQDC
jgi:hypothetical protein